MRSEYRKSIQQISEKYPGSIFLNVGAKSILRVVSCSIFFRQAHEKILTCSIGMRREYRKSIQKVSKKYPGSIFVNAGAKSILRVVSCSIFFRQAHERY